MTKRQEIEIEIHQAIERLDDARLHLILHKFDVGSAACWTEVVRETKEEIQRLEAKLDATPPGIPA
jgi:dihydroxyacetone kinase DhaKLM complex PTS-EIIA-like component DhaM